MPGDREADRQLTLSEADIDQRNVLMRVLGRLGWLARLEMPLTVGRGGRFRRSVIDSAPVQGVPRLKSRVETSRGTSSCVPMPVWSCGSTVFPRQVYLQ